MSNKLEYLVEPYRKSGNPVGPWYYPGSGKLVDEVIFQFESS